MTRMIDWTKIASYPLDTPSDETRLLASTRKCRALTEQQQADQNAFLLRCLTYMGRKAK